MYNFLRGFIIHLRRKQIKLEDQSLGINFSEELPRSGCRNGAFKVKITSSTPTKQVNRPKLTSNTGNLFFSKQRPRELNNTTYLTLSGLLKRLLSPGISLKSLWGYSTLLCWREILVNKMDAFTFQLSLVLATRKQAGGMTGTPEHCCPFLPSQGLRNRKGAFPQVLLLGTRGSRLCLGIKHNTGKLPEEGSWGNWGVGNSSRGRQVVFRSGCFRLSVFQNSGWGRGNKPDFYLGKYNLRAF